MNNEEFKKILQNSISSVGFIYCKKNYYCNVENMIAMINLQKSNYENGYYINFGFCVEEIHNDLKYPKISECDIMGRFLNVIDLKQIDIIQLDLLNKDKLEYLIKENLNSVIIPVLNNGIHEYFKIFPDAIYTARLDLKKYLGVIS